MSRTRARTRGGIALVGVLLGSACGGGAPEAPDPEPAPVGAREPEPAPPPVDPDSARDDFVRNGLAPPVGTIAALRDALGSPDRVEVEEMANRHVPEQTDSILTLRYPGLMAEYYRVRGRDLPLAFRVTESRHLARDWIRIGMRWEDARRILGEARDEGEGIYSYDCGSCMGADEPVFFEVTEGRVAAIVFTFYVD